MPRSHADFLHATPTPHTRLLTARSTCAAPVTHPQHRAVSFNLLYEGRVLPRPPGLLSAVPTRISSSRGARAGPQAAHMSDPGPVPSASSIAGWHGVRHSAGCFMDYYLLSSSDGARPPLEPSDARPHAMPPSRPRLGPHFSIVPPCLLRCRWRPSRPRCRSTTLVAGLGRRRGASSAAAAAAAVPRARFSAGWAARMAPGAALGPRVGGSRGS